MSYRIITQEELAQHKSEGDLWLSIHGFVYDVSDFMLDVHKYYNSKLSIPITYKWALLIFEIQLPIIGTFYFTNITFLYLFSIRVGKRCCWSMQPWMPQMRLIV